MKKIYILFLLFSLCTSCVKYHDPEYETLENYYFGFQVSQGVKYMAGEYVGDSIQFYVYGDNGLPYRQAKIKWRGES